MNPHMSLVALDPPREHPPRRWRCLYCQVEGFYEEVHGIACTFVYPPCEYCGQTPWCALDCPGIAAIFASPDVHVAGLGPPKKA